MAQIGMADLDELILRCRNPQAKQCIEEAVACYKAGAFRSTIVFAWIALVYDFIHKLQELSQYGDNNAKEILNKYTHISGVKNINGSLEFERSVLIMARDEFQLISQMEFIDLERLQGDRNRCAHPSMNSIDQHYEPSAELARLHLRNTVNYFLSLPPVQGKAALESLMAEVKSQYFPVSVSSAKQYFVNGPLVRPRPSLIAQFIILAIKEFRTEPDLRGEQRFFAAINAVREMHREITEETLSRKLPELIKRLIVDQVPMKALKFVCFVPDSWMHVGVETQILIQAYVRRMPSKDLVPGLRIAMHEPNLKANATERLSELGVDSMRAVVSELDEVSDKIPPEFIDHAIGLYDQSDNYYQANDIANFLLRPFVRSLSAKQVSMIAECGSNNSQISGSRGFEPLLQSIESAKILPRKDMRLLLAKYGLEEVIN